MRLLYKSRWVTIVTGVPLYARQWRATGKVPAFGLLRAPQGGLHIALFGRCIGVKI